MGLHQPMEFELTPDLTRGHFAQVNCSFVAKFTQPCGDVRHHASGGVRQSFPHRPLDHRRPEEDRTRTDPDIDVDIGLFTGFCAGQRVCLLSNAYRSVDGIDGVGVSPYDLTRGLIVCRYR